jgi:hypothetical protein
MSPRAVLAVQPTIKETMMPRKKKLPAAKQAYHAARAEDSAENSIPRQQEQVRQWADDHDIEIVREYADGPSPPEESQDD